MINDIDYETSMGHFAGHGGDLTSLYSILGVKPDYGLKSEYLSGEVDVSSAAEMHAVAAAAGLGQASAASAAPLPTLMHMGYGAPHHRHAMLASNHQDQSGMCSYLQHRSAW